MKSFDEIVEQVLEHEGGYVNDPNDLGGETNWGITKRFYPELDIKHLTRAKAKDIYRRDYWDRNNVESLPQELWHIYFDMCVNMGKRTAVKVLQRAANSMSKGLTIDGGLGPNTIKALELSLIHISEPTRPY